MPQPNVEQPALRRYRGSPILGAHPGPGPTPEDPGAPMLPCDPNSGDQDEWEEMVDRAIQMSDDAMDADSTNVEAHHQAAHALGRYAQGIGAFTALRQGLAGRIRESG